jgi:hypothetical protein
MLAKHKLFILGILQFNVVTLYLHAQIPTYPRSPRTAKLEVRFPTAKNSFPALFWTLLITLYCLVPHIEQDRFNCRLTLQL